MEFKLEKWKIKAMVGLLLLSILIYAATIIIFNDFEHTIWYIFIDLAFIPIDIVIVVFFVEDIIDRKEKEMIFEKMDMLMSVFFSEVGNSLLINFSKLDSHNAKIQSFLMDIEKADENEMVEILKKFKNQPHQFDLKLPEGSEEEFLLALKNVLYSKREFLVRMLENPNLLEKESLSNLLLAIFHLDEELEHRNITSTMPKTDIGHLIGDIDRVYFHLIYEWLNHLYYLKIKYPYMFSLALRTNPFDKEATVQVLK
ncbi:MAG: hypothetical protein LBM96_07115 [Methanobrevibacter sp.]|jgi:hypothetical protein|nr:hypothetical protein [Candidatus Methanoflexus mossambicus]